MERPKHYWEYGPNPTNLLNSAIRMAFEPWNYGWIGETKSHGWEWYRKDYPENFEGTLLPGDPRAFLIRSGILKFPSLLAMENRWFGWDQVRVLKPDLELLDSGRSLESWRYAWSPAWQELDKAFLDVCRINVNLDQAIRVMVGRRDFRVHGIGNDDLEVPLKVSGPLSRKRTRNDPSYKNIPLS